MIVLHIEAETCVLLTNKYERKEKKNLKQDFFYIKVCKSI